MNLRNYNKSFFVNFCVCFIFCLFSSWYHNKSVVSLHLHFQFYSNCHKIRIIFFICRFCNISVDNSTQHFIIYYGTVHPIFNWLTLNVYHSSVLILWKPENHCLWHQRLYFLFKKTFFFVGGTGEEGRPIQILWRHWTWKFFKSKISNSSTNQR